MAAQMGAFTAQLLFALLCGYLFAGAAKLFKGSSRSQFVAASVGVLLISVVTLARAEVGTWIAAAIVVGFFYWRHFVKTGNKSAA